MFIFGTVKDNRLKFQFGLRGLTSSRIQSKPCSSDFYLFGQLKDALCGKKFAGQKTTWKSRKRYKGGFGANRKYSLPKELGSYKKDGTST